MASPIFTLNHVSYSYIPDRWVLRDISVSIHQGESLVLLGANGSGKTTFQKILSGLLHPTEGTFTAFGEDMTEQALHNQEKMAAFRRNVGIVLQNSDAQLFCADVRSEIRFGMEMAGMPADICDKRVEDLLDMLSIRKLEKEAPHYLSGGEKKKVALAAILAVNPEVLILDEPTNGLDPRSARWLLAFMEELIHRGKTIIFSTHQLEHWPALATRALLFGEDHRLLADRSVEGVMEDKILLERANLI